jgi:hypothetical protein
MEKLATEQLGRKVTVGAVDFKPWTLELTCPTWRSPTSRATQAQFQFKRLYVNAELESCCAWPRWSTPWHWTRPRCGWPGWADGKYDMDDIVARFDKPASGQAV